MVDSTASYGRDAELPSYAPLSGGRLGGQRGSRATNQPSDGLDGAGPEHASALLAMGAAKQAAGDYSEAEDLFRKALEIGERFLGTDNAVLIPALTSLASACVMCGKLADAQQLAKRAVQVSENGLVEHEPEVAILINDLARLCLKQSAYGVAEPLLLRLLEMKRSKGEDHPEVGTVLASLATVRHALGRHESAEHLWRRVLEIRERTLAPNHFGLATALEHLAETCAARGKIGEALQHFQRAQNIRELTLGAGHPSLRIARDRIADLQLQAGESLDYAPAPAPDKYRLLAANNGVASQSLVSPPPPPVRERSDAPRKGSAWVVEREPVIEAIAPPLIEAIAPAPPPPAPSLADVAPAAAVAKPTAPEARPVAAEVRPAAPEVRPAAAEARPAAAEARPAAAEARPATAEPASYRDVILSIQQEMDEDEEEDDVDDTTASAPGLLASIGAAVKERRHAVLIGVGVVALVAILATASRAWTESGQSATSTVAALPTSSPVAAPAVDASSKAAPPGSGSQVAAAVVAAAGTPVTASRIRLADQKPAAKKPTETRPEPARISIPKVSSALAAGFDSVVRVRTGSEGGVTDQFPIQPPPMAATSQRIAFERDDPNNQAQRAQLIGSLPVPRYPAQLRGEAQGEVRVRVDVDSMGRPVMSSASVVSSPNPLLSSAVLKVIPNIRFEPARSGGADSKRIADVVQLTFQFRPTN